MKMLSLFVSSIAMMGAPLVSQAALVENGSAFTGSYIVQEQDCEKNVLSPLTGKNILVPEFSFEGTTAGLKIDGMLTPIQAAKLVDHGGGIQTSFSAEYRSGNEFVANTVVISPLLNQGQKTSTTLDYAIAVNGSFNEIVKTTTVTIGNNSPTISECHYLGHP